MAAIPRVQRAPAGGGQGHGDGPYGRTLTAGRSIIPRSFSDIPVADTGRAPFCRSRFLKVHHENLPGSPWCQTSGSAVQRVSRDVAKSTAGEASCTRSSLALRKVAQLESKIMNRKKQMELQTTALGQKPWDEESLSSTSSHERSARGKKYLKNSAITSSTRNMTLSNDCSREESKTPVSSGMPAPSPKEISPTEVAKKSHFHSKDLGKNVFGRVNSPVLSAASRNLSVQHNTRSQLLSSMKDDTVKVTLPRKSNTKQRQISSDSDRSEIKSLDELFSKADDAEDSTSSSSNDFRLNILSLDDLAPNITSEAAELKQNGTDIQITEESNKNPKKDSLLVEKDQTSLKMTSTVTGVSDASEGDTEKTVTEAEISEHLSGVSADFPRHKQKCLDHEERTLNSEYSEDFESSLSTTDGESGSKMSEGHSESCTYSGKHSPSALSPLFSRERCDQAHGVTVRETAVQTVDPPFTYSWTRTNTSAVLDPPVGNSYIDPIPIASHVISADAVEALTAYSPSVLVLNSMLKQHLMLTQQFVKNIHHLHVSLVESLEQERFHYHTLEEAKEYIKNHKSPPLTIEQAREEIRKAQEGNLL